jgi:thiol-disulfide isomerase/thioredoxin
MKRFWRILALLACLLIVTQISDPDREMPFAPSGERTAAREFTLPTLQGVPWSLQAQRGKVVLLNYWATWCPPCREEIPALNSLARRFAPRGVRVVGINADGDAAASRAFASQLGVGYPILIPDGTLPDAVDALPTTFLYDAQGRVARRWVGAISEDEVAADIEKLLAEPRP